MGANEHLPAYYRQRYISWYRWFSRIYDPFAKLLLFVLNGGPGGERRLRESVIGRLAPVPGDKVVDICSGTGTLSLMLAERLSGTGEIQGIEISEYQLAVARRKQIPGNVTFTQGDAQHLPFDDSHFDRAVIFGALHEIPRDARRNILAQACRVLKPGGRIVILEHNRPAKAWRALLYRLLEWPSPEYSTYVDLLDSGLQNEITGAGFRILDTAVVASQYFQVVAAEKPGPDAT